MQEANEKYFQKVLEARNCAFAPRISNAKNLYSFLITTNQIFLAMKPNNQFDNGWVTSAALLVRILHTIFNNLLYAFSGRKGTAPKFFFNFLARKVDEHRIIQECEQNSDQKGS